MENYRILVVDDSQDSRSLLVRMLKKAGYEHVSSVESGERALAVLSAEKPDLILLDVKMSGIDGLEVCRRLKKDPDTSGIPIIFISGADDAEERLKGLSVGAVDYVNKPFNMEELVARVRIQLELHGLRKMLEQEKDKIHSILSSSPVGMIVFNSDRRIVYANPAAEKLFGNKILYPDCNCCGDFLLCRNRNRDPRGCGFSKDCETCPLLRSIMEILYSDAGQVEREGEACLHVDGKDIPLHVRFKAKSFFLEGRRSVLVSLEDVTEMKLEEEALRKIQDLLNETGRMAKVGGWELDIATNKLLWTEEVYRIHEVDMDFAPTVEKGIGFYAPASRPIIGRVVQLAIEKGEPFDVELEIITAKGNQRAVHATGKADLGRGIILGTFQDITDRRKIEKERESLIARLNETLEKVKQLQGILPICMHCKRIRNDKGYWNQLETYISDHSEAEFSHGLCPDCMKKHYPGIEIEKDGA